MASQEATDHVKAIMEHAQQVAAGLLPVDSPPEFVRPEGEDAMINGLPWWFGENYKPDEAALRSFQASPVDPEIVQSQT